MSEVVIPSPAELETNANVLDVVRAKKTQPIATAVEYEQLADLLSRIKAMRQVIADHHAPLKRKSRELWQAHVDKEKADDAPWAEAEQTAKSALLAYTADQQRLAQEEQRRLQAEADARSQREKEALEKKAAAARKPETKARYEEAAAAVAPAPVVHVAAAVPRVVGITTRETWKAEIIDTAAFLSWACEAKRTDLLLPCLPMLQALAKSQKGAVSIPGVRFRPEATLASSGRR